MIDSYIKYLKLANHLILTIPSSPTLPAPLPCSRQRNYSFKLDLQINCQVSIPAATSQKAQKSNGKDRENRLRLILAVKTSKNHQTARNERYTNESEVKREKN